MTRVLYPARTNWLAGAGIDAPGEGLFQATPASMAGTVGAVELGSAIGVATFNAFQASV